MSGFLSIFCLAFPFLLVNALDQKQMLICKCSSSSCGAPTCEINNTLSCYQVFVDVMGGSGNSGPRRQVEVGCVESTMEPGVEKRLTIILIEPSGFTSLAVWQCASNECNNLGKGITPHGMSTCHFPQQFHNASTVTFQWSSNGTLVNNISDWCSTCNRSMIQPPSGNETLCEWAHRILGLEFKRDKKSRPPSSKAYLYASVGVTGVFLLSITLSIFEYVKAKKLKRVKPRIPRKKLIADAMGMSSVGGPALAGKLSPSTTKNGEPGKLTAETATASKETTAEAESKEKGVESAPKAKLASKEKLTETPSKGSTAGTDAKAKVSKSLKGSTNPRSAKSPKGSVKSPNSSIKSKMPVRGLTIT